MSPAGALTWGILGCARITKSGLIRGIQQSANSRLAALASRDRTKAESWAREFDIPKSYGSYEELVADPEIQAVYIPLPNELHAPWTKAAADAGKHVLCEKPLTIDSAEARAMVDHCRARGVLLMEGFMWRHQPRTVELLRQVREGAIGELRLVRTSFSFPIDPADWRLDPNRGGGALWDIGTYGVSTARLFAGAEPEDVQAQCKIGATGVDISLTCLMRFPREILALIDCSFEQPFRCCYELVGTKGTIEVPDAYLPPARPIARLRAGESEQTLAFDGRNQYAAMVDAFTQAVNAGKLTKPCEDGLDQIIVLDRVLHAAAR